MWKFIQRLFGSSRRGPKRGRPSCRPRVEAFEDRVLLAANVGFALGLARPPGWVALNASALATDSAGNIYAGGVFEGTIDFAPGVAGGDVTAVSTQDLYVAKYSRTGSLIWVNHAGGTVIGQRNPVKDIAVDASGNVLITGSFQADIDFKPGVSGGELPGHGVSDEIYVSKYDQLGNHLWAVGVGGPREDFGNGITTDAAGNVYVTGAFATSVDFDPDPNVEQILANFAPAAETTDIFVWKLDDDGNYVSASQYGYGHMDYGYDIAVDSAGNMYMAGGIDWVTVPGPARDLDIYVIKLDPSHNILWSQRLASTNRDTAFARSIALDASGNVYTTGVFREQVDFDGTGPAAPLTGTAGSDDIFVWKMNNLGNHLWVRQFGNASHEQPARLGLDAANNVYLAGWFSGTVDFNPSAAGGDLTAAGTDVFALKLTTLGLYVWARPAGGTGNDAALAVAVDAAGTVLTGGIFENPASFEVGSSSTTFMFPGAFIWQVAGPMEFTADSGDGGDDFTLRRNGDFLELFDNVANTVVASRRLATTTNVLVTGANGEADALTLDFDFGGSFTLPGGVRFDGGTGAGNNRLMLRDHNFLSEVYTATNAHSGSIALYSSLFAISPAMTVSYANVQTLEDLRAVNTGFFSVYLTLNATNFGDWIDVSNATLAATQATRVSSTFGTFAALTFANWNGLTVNALGGADTISLNNSSPAAGLRGITVNAGNDNDQIYINQTASGTPVNVYGGLHDDSFFVSNVFAASMNGIQGALRLYGDGHNVRDSLYLYDSNETVARQFTVHAASISRTGAATIDYSSFERLELYAGRTAGDTLTLTDMPAVTTALIDGGGTSGTDTFTGPNRANTWNINANEQGTLNATLTSNLEFREMENLVGGSQNDRFVFANTAQVRSIDGMGGHDTYDYTAYQTAVTVRLMFAEATGTTNFTRGIEQFIGSAFADTLIGDNLDNLFVGMGGDDTIQGGGGYDVLIGGDGIDTITGGDGEDIVIGGMTDYDTDPADLQEIWTAWTDPALRTRYGDRITRLRAGVGTGNAIHLRPSAIFNDFDNDILDGNAGLDWYFTHPGDTRPVPLEPGEQEN